MKKLYYSFPLSLFGLFFAKPVSAHCPLCVAGAGAGLTLSRFLGIDDSITGIWIAAFLGATALWIANSIRKKHVPLQSALIYIVVFATTLWSFYKFNLVNNHAGLIMGVPKITFGILSGAVVFYLIDVLNNLIKKTKGKVLFSYQPIVFSLGAMVLLSFAMFIFINYFI